MTYNNRIIIFSGIFFSFFGSSLCSQNLSMPSENYKETYIAFDSLLGMENLEISSGVEYIERHRMLNEKHKFFQSFDFQKGTVFYDGQPYFNINMKYNVVDDVVLVQLQNKGAQNIIQLYSSKLDGFKFRDRLFVNVSEGDGLPVQGIFEVIFEDSGDKILKKHLLKEKKILEKKLLHYEFEADKPEYFFFHEGEIQEMNIKNLVNIFPQQKEEIRKYFRKHRKNLKNDPDSYLINLYQDLIKEGISE